VDTSDLLKRVRQIEIKTRALSNNIFAGEYHSAYKGHGMSFSEVREYQFGDDIRDIDWNVTARFNHPYIKIFEEERELTVMLLIDVSSSLSFGTVNMFQRDMVTEIAATLACSAIQNNDKIGVILFSDKVEEYIPPKKGRKHILYIIREILNFKPDAQQTDIKVALEFLMNTQHKSCTAFLISDFIDRNDYSQAVLIANRKHDLAAIQVYDRFMAALPNVGLIKVCDAEKGHEQYIDSSSKKVRDAHSRSWSILENNLTETMNKSSVDLISIRTDEDYVKALINLFSKRR